MKAAALLQTALLVATTAVGACVQDRTDGDDLTESPELRDLFEQAKNRVLEELGSNAKKLRSRGQKPKCTAEKLIFRKE